MESAKVTILGARGSIPVSGERYSVYGCATSCVLMEAASDVLFFDAGSGILNVPQEVCEKHKRIHIFLSHLHIDHLLGILMSPMMYDKDREIIFYAKDGYGACTALQQMMKKPLWAIGPETFTAKMSYRTVPEEPYQIPESNITVKGMYTSHPGGSMAYRVEWEGNSLVYATDCELDEAQSRQMEKFADKAALFILDAQYTGEEYPKCIGYGHSYIENSVSVIAGSGAKRGLLFHHAPTHTDEQLAEIEKCLHKRWNQITFAKEGDIITI